MLKLCYPFLLAVIHVIHATGQAESVQTVRKNRALPLICGHRGGFYENYPENSLAAINHTVQNCHTSQVIIEFDLRKSKDGTLFIMHDESVDRTTSGQGLISELPDSHLKTLFLRNANGKLTDEKIPTFDDLLDYSQAKKIILMLDIKADIWNEAIDKLVKRNLTHKSIVLTFQPLDAKKVYDLSHDVRISCLVRNENDWQAIKELSIPAKNLIGYIGESTPQHLIIQLKNNLSMIMADVSESAMSNVNILTNEYYFEFIKKRKIDILITDYPVDVSKRLR